jgi:hypothetical protein
MSSSSSSSMSAADHDRNRRRKFAADHEMFNSGYTRGRMHNDSDEEAAAFAAGVPFSSTRAHTHTHTHTHATNTCGPSSQPTITGVNGDYFVRPNHLYMEGMWHDNYERRSLPLATDVQAEYLAGRRRYGLSSTYYAQVPRRPQVCKPDRNVAFLSDW